MTKLFLTKYKFILIALAIQLCARFSTFSQKSPQFDQLTAESGLSSSNIRSICQDSSGYIWIGTTDGLNRYDGINFTDYNHVPGDSSTLADNFVYRLLVDRKGKIWIGTLKGLNVFDPAIGEFKLIPLVKNLNGSIEQLEIYAIAADYQNNIWVSTSRLGGVFKINKTLDNNLAYVSEFISLPEVISTPDKPLFVLSIFFRTITEGWLSTPYTLYKMTFLKGFGKEEKIIWKKIIDDPEKDKSFKKRIEHIIDGGSGTLLIYDLHGNIDRIIPSLNNNYVKDSLVEIFSATRNKLNYETLSALKDHAGSLWIGTSNDGVLKISPEIIPGQNKTNFSIFKSNSRDSRSILSNQAFALFEDKSGLLWIGNDIGVSVYNPNKDYFNVSNSDLFPGETDVSVTALYNDDEYLWLGTDYFGVAGLNKKTGDTIKIFNQYNKPTSLSNNGVQSLTKDRNGNLWIGTLQGLNFIKKSNVDALSIGRSYTGEVLNTFKSDNETNALSPSSNIFSLLEDEENQLWIATGKGLFCLNLLNNTIISKFDSSRNKRNFLSDNIIRCLYIDKKNQILIGTENGFNILNKKTGAITKFYNNPSDQNSLSSNRIASIYQTDDSVYWIGTNGGGLNSFDIKNSFLKRYTVQNGLPNNVINTIVDDNSGNLWLSTNKGISKFDIKGKTFTNYDVNDGLKSNSFNIGAALKSSDGEIFFGSIKGINSFYPNLISKNTFIPPIVITDIKIFDKSVFDSSFEEIKSSLLNEKFIELEANQNFFSFEFAALNYINPAKNQYKYKLEGVDPDWIQNGTRRFASYTNIDPGTYTFRVIGSNNDGTWNEEGASVAICINPPVYKTWWFRTMTAIIIAFFISFVTQMRIRAVHEKKERELAEHSSVMKQQFLANMSHEIRTPMNAILGMTRLLIDKEPRDDQKKYLNAIKQSSDNLLVIINDILDFSKIEAGKLELEFIPFSILKMIEGVYNTMQFKSTEKGLELTYKIDEKVPAAVIGDSVRINEVLINLVGNSIKFTQRGSVRISCRNLGVYSDSHGTVIPDIVNIEFSVSDTGIGIPQDKIATIFESFSQASSSTTRKYGGTGLGLTISKYLVELHGGKISIKSKEGSGTVFTCIIPFELTDAENLSVQKMTDDHIPKSSLSLLKILLVEDNEFNQIVAVDTLQSHIPGITIDVAVNGKDAVERVKENNFDLVLMDIQMPEMDGYEATQYIRNQLAAPKNSIKIIAMTAGALKSEVQNCFDAGMDDYIAKPFDPDVLIGKMNELFNKV